MLQYADDNTQQSVILEQLLSCRRTDVRHKSQNLKDLLLDFNRHLIAHQHTQKHFDVLRDCWSQSFVPFVDKTTQ